MSLETYMSKSLITVFLDDDLKKVKEKFDRYDLHHLLVIDDDGVLFGIISDRDLYKHLSPTVGTLKENRYDSAMLNKKAHTIMNRELVTADLSYSINQAVVSFYDNDISCLPIIDQNKKPIGIITWRDIVKIIALQYKKKLEKNN